jgi:hypothetical protein
MKIITILTLITIIATASMIIPSMTQQANAGPKVEKTTSHFKATFDPTTGEYVTRDHYNTNGPFFHDNCKTNSPGNSKDRCISN